MNAILPILSAAATYGPSLMRYSKHAKPMAKGAMKLLKFVKKNPKKAKQYASAAGKVFSTAGGLIKMARNGGGSNSTMVSHPARSVPVTTYSPVYTGATGKKQVMKAEEFIGAVVWYPASPHFLTTATAGAIECLPVNPIFWQNTRINTAIRNYQTWRVASMSLEFVPTLGSNWAGTVALAVMPQDHAIPADMDPVSLASSLSALPGFKTCPIQSVGLPPSQRQVSCSEAYTSCISQPDPISNPVISIVVTDLVSPDGTVPAESMTIGKLLVRYTVVMQDPCPAWGLDCGISQMRASRNTTGVCTLTDGGGSGALLGGNLQADVVRVCRSWSAGSTALLPKWTSDLETSAAHMPGNLVMHDENSFTSSDTGGWNIFSGAPLACICKRTASQTYTMKTPAGSDATRSLWCNDLRICDRRTGLDLATFLTDTAYGYLPQISGQFSMYTGFRACVLPSRSQAPVDVDGGLQSSTAVSYLRELTSAYTTTTDPAADTVEVTTTTTPEPAEPRVAVTNRRLLALDPSLPPIRK